MIISINASLLCGCANKSLVRNWPRMVNLKFGCICSYSEGLRLVWKQKHPNLPGICILALRC